MKNNKAYYFQFDASIWMSSMSKIQLCSSLEKGIFIDLCAMCLLKGGVIEYSENDEILARLLRVDNPSLTGALNTLLKLNLVVKDGSGLGVKFILEKLADMKISREKSVIDGKKGGRPKGSKRVVKGPSQEEVLVIEEERIKEQVILKGDIDVVKKTKKHKNESGLPVSIENQCESIREEFPKKGEWLSDLKAIAKALEYNQFDYLLEKAKRYKELTQNENKQFIPLCSTWFNGARYKDPEETWMMKFRHDQEPAQKPIREY